MDRGAWWATVHGVTKSLSVHIHTHTHTHTHTQSSTLNASASGYILHNAI